MIEQIGSQLASNKEIVTIYQPFLKSMATLAVKLGSVEEPFEIDWMPLFRLIQALETLELAELVVLTGNIINYASILPDDKKWILEQIKRIQLT